MKRLTLPVILAVTLALSGCGGAEAGLRAIEVPLPDGSSVTCVANTTDSRSGVSCDW